MTDNKAKIVVIDDSPTSISLYERSSAPLDVELTTFTSPKASLEYLRDENADLIFIDVLIREKDGLTLLKELRSMPAHAATSVVIVTSKDYAQDRTMARQLGALEYLVKPLRSQEIREIICKYSDARPLGDG